MDQPNLFDSKNESTPTGEILLFALGEFQSRGKVLAERELPLDRLRGAFRRAAEKHQVSELSDESIIDSLEQMGAKIVRKPSFVAKHPFRVTVTNDLAQRAREVYQNSIQDD